MRTEVARAVRTGVLEIVLLLGWAYVVIHPYFAHNAGREPAEQDYIVSSLGHHMWDRVWSCGACAMWNGDVRGGVPAFIDVLGAGLHPIIAVSTSLWGVVEGGQIAVFWAFFLAGVGQWWLGRELGLSPVARCWTAAMAIAAGNLFGPLSAGLVPMVVANASFAVLLPAVMRVASGRGGRRSTTAAGAAVGLFLLAGHGYTQIAVVVLSPLLAVLVVKTEHVRRVARELAIAVGVGFLIAAPLIVPFVHFLPQFQKEIDVRFIESQPFGGVAANLVMDDTSFYRSDSFGKEPYPGWYLNYVGWIAVVLAVVGVAVLWGRGLRRLTLFLGGLVAGAFFLASGTPFHWLYLYNAGVDGVRDFGAGIRHPSLMAGIAIPPVLAFAGIGFDQALRGARTIGLASVASLGRVRTSVPALATIATVAVGAVALQQEHSAATTWLSIEAPDRPDVDRVLDDLATTDLQWVQPPYGDGRWISRAIERGQKVAYYHVAWDWKSRSDPAPVAVVVRPDQVSELVASGNVVTARTADDLVVLASPSVARYATLHAADGSTAPCIATGEGGDIDIRCEADQPAELIVLEHQASGWHAEVDGRESEVRNHDGWIAVDLPAGATQTELRYRPWDVPVGIAAALIGWSLVLYRFIRPARARARSTRTREHRRPPCAAGE